MKRMRSDILEKSVKWKGPKAKYHSIHQTARKHYLKNACEHCGATEKLQMANISGEYRREPDDWLTLCAGCHHVFDDQARRQSLGAKGGISGFRGIKPNGSGWMARIMIDYYEVYLGQFKDFEDAVMIRLAAEEQLL